MTFFYIDIDATTAALVLHLAEVHADRGIDGQSLNETRLAVGGDVLLFGLGEDGIGNQTDSRGLLNAVERDQVKQLDQGSVAIFAAGHIAVTGTLIGREHG